MTDVIIKHKKQSNVADSPNTDLVRPSDWNDTHNIENLDVHIDERIDIVTHDINIELTQVIIGSTNNSNIAATGSALLVENEGNEDITITVNEISFKVRSGSITPSITHVGDFTSLGVSGIVTTGDYQLFIYGGM